MSELDEITDQIHHLSLLNPNETNNETKIKETLSFLRKKIAHFPDIQNLIAENSNFLRFLQALLSVHDPIIEKNVWQLLANTIVQNERTQEIIWHAFGSAVLETCASPPLSGLNDVKLMILYNIYLSKLQLIRPETVFEIIARFWQTIIDEKCEQKFDFLHLIFEHFLVHNFRIGVNSYARLSSEHRVIVLDYLVTYIRNDSPNGNINKFWLHHISKEFKLKSDWILRTTQGPSDDNLKPREVYALLRVIASASGSEQYAEVFATDHSLFLNVSSVLRALVAVGKQASPNSFTPMTKLEEVTPNSPLPHDFELELSYELKTLLVRCVANLLYKNKTNQGYCLDTQLLPTLFESTNLDARNPLLKEWSILAIRNACDGCPEIQELVANLTKVGEAPNNILKELNLQMGSLRIKPDIS